tara:strand:- start:246 stop:497 length:252 start_codon:yes stop_codon:yes gene_type:complete
MGNSKRIQDNWLTSLEEVIREDEERVPEGWLSMIGLAKRLGVSRCHANKQVNELIEAGKAEMKTFRVWRGNRIYPVPHYKLKE